MNEPRWLTLNPSPFPWENEALAFVRPRLPEEPQHLARALFEFIADDGSVNEVDLLVLSPMGLFLVEIKSWPGFVWGDALTWSCKHEGRTRTFDNPLVSADRKAKKLRSLLQRQKAAQSVKVPFIDPLVFLSAPDIDFGVKGNGRLKVCLRDRDGAADPSEEAGVIAALLERRCPGLDPHRAPAVDRKLEKALARAGAGRHSALAPLARSERLPAAAGSSGRTGISGLGGRTRETPCPEARAHLSDPPGRPFRRRPRRHPPWGGAGVRSAGGAAASQHPPRPGMGRTRPRPGAAVRALPRRAAARPLPGPQTGASRTGRLSRSAA